MKLPKFDYVKPKFIREACELLEAAGGHARPIAGGTELLMAMKNRQALPKMLVDLGGLPLNRISYSDDEGLRVGALVSLRHLANHSVVREKYSVLAQAASSAGTVQLQAMGTLGGNLCQNTCCVYFDRATGPRQTLGPCIKLDGQVCYVVEGSEKCWAGYAGDLAPALLVLRAKLKIADSRGEKIMPLRELFSNDGKCPQTLLPGQIITEIHVPRADHGSGGAYLKLRQRETLDYPLLGVAAHFVMEAGGAVCKDAALALTAVDHAPMVIEGAGRLIGKAPTNDLIQELASTAHKNAHPIKSVCGIQVRYRKNMVNVFAESAIRQALEAATH
jgi:4-hydroxybenzoyl-CoA reductase subunit beta